MASLLDVKIKLKKIFSGLPVQFFVVVEIWYSKIYSNQWIIGRFFHACRDPDPEIFLFRI
jgi:hypothetical protein